MKIVAVLGDITDVDVDAVISPADAPQELRRRIEDRLVHQAGRDVEHETVARGPLQVGEAMLTTGGRLRCRYVIHAPFRAGASVEDPDVVKQSTLAALRVAAGSGLRSVAIPAFPRAENATKALVRAIREFDEEGGLDEVLLVAGNDRVEEEIRKEIAERN